MKKSIKLLVTAFSVMAMLGTTAGINQVHADSSNTIDNYPFTLSQLKNPYGLQLPKPKVHLSSATKNDINMSTLSPEYDGDNVFFGINDPLSNRGYFTYYIPRFKRAQAKTKLMIPALKNQDANIARVSYKQCYPEKDVLTFTMKPKLRKSGSYDQIKALLTSQGDNIKAKSNNKTLKVVVK